MELARNNSLNDLDGYTLGGPGMIREPKRKKNFPASESEAVCFHHEIFQRSRSVKSQNPVDGFSVTRRKWKLINFSKSPERKSRLFDDRYHLSAISFRPAL
jgi:hypothetical protein